MSTWRIDKSSKMEEWKPRRHLPEKQLWRDFSVLVSKSGRVPGVLHWIVYLRQERKLASFQANVMIAGIAYGDKDFFVDGIISDNLSINADLLTKLGEAWQNRIVDVLKETELAVTAFGKLASDLAISRGGDPDKAKTAAVRKPAREQAWYQLDEPFRAWLRGLHPDQNMEDALVDWKKQAQDIIIQMGRDLVKDSSDQALTGRYVMRNKVEQLYCAPLAYRWF